MITKSQAFSLLEVLISLIIFSSLILSLYVTQLQLLHQSQLLWQENQTIFQETPIHDPSNLEPPRV
jgi:prepilin-type N-terminal cleavage/methylation domain-containing protein